MPHLLFSTLGVICPSCERLNPAGATTCAECGSSLHGTPAAPPAPQFTAVASPPEPQLPPPPGFAPPPVPTPAPGAFPPGMRRNQGATPVPGGPPAGAGFPGTPAPVPSAGATSSSFPVPGVAGPPFPPGTPMVPAARPQSVPTPAPQGPYVSAGTPIPRGSSPSGIRQGTPVGSKFIVGVVAGPARGQRFRLMASGCSVGRSKGAILFPDDTFVSPQHAAFRVKDGNLYVRDEQSASGVFVSIVQQENIPVLGMFCAGARLFRYLGAIERRASEPGHPIVYGAPMALGSALYGLEELLVGGRSGRILTSPGPSLSLGLTNCDLSFPTDVGMASRHCELSPLPNGALLRDLSGGLGTFVRLLPQQERLLRAGDRVRIGQQTLQIEVSG